MNQIKIHEKYIDVIKKGNFSKISEDKYSIKNDYLGDMTISIYDDWVHTELLENNKNTKFLISWEGNVYTGKCNFIEEDEHQRFNIFKSYMEDYINYKIK